MTESKEEQKLLRLIAHAAHERERIQVEFDNIQEGKPFMEVMTRLIDARTALRDSLVDLQNFYKVYPTKDAPQL